MFANLITSCFKIIFLLSIVSYFYSCSIIPEKIDLKKTYKLDAMIKDKAQDKEQEGMVVLDLKNLVTIQVSTSDKINYVSFRSCSREHVEQDPRTGLSRKTYTINYQPNEIEAKGNCPVIVSAFNEQNMLSMGYIDFQDSSTMLPAINICEDKIDNSKGVSVCQSRSSSLEKIKFDVEVLTSPDSGCELDQVKGKEFIYRIHTGYCTYAFMETKSPYRIHRLTTYGYDSIQIR